MCKETCTFFNLGLLVDYVQFIPTLKLTVRADVLRLTEPGS